MYPGTARAGDVSSLLISGRGLSRIYRCEVLPVSALASETGQLNNICTVEPAQADDLHRTQQLTVRIDLTSVKAFGAFFLKLESEGNGKAKLETTVPFTVFPAADAVGTSKAAQPAKPAPVSTGPFALCLNASPSAVPALASQLNTAVNCSSSVLTDHEASDNFGYHVSKEYYAVQVRVSNQNPSFDFLLRDILLTLPDGRVVSGRIRRFAQGVALKGKSEDRRSYIANSIQAVGAVYGAGVVLPVAATLKNVGNLFQGPLLSAMNQIWPDYTADNINRFNNAVFDDQNPSIVPKDSIGQPPLYVIALIPKPSASYPFHAHFIDMVSVALEGTFIKEVNSVTISPTNIAFAPEFITPQDYTKSFGANFSLTALQGASPGSQVSISNLSAAAITINKLSLISTAAGSGPSADFQFVTDRGNCGSGGDRGKPWDPNEAFTIPANQSCQFFVRSTPQAIGTTSATLIVDGNNLDGSKNIALSGSGVGLLLDTGSATAAINPFPIPFQCSLIAGPCAMDLGNLSGDSLSIPVYYQIAKGSSDTLTATQDNGPGATRLDTTNCKPVALPPPSPLVPSCALRLEGLQSAANSSTTLKITFGVIVETIKFTFTTVKTVAAISSPADQAPLAADKSLEVKVTVKDTTAGGPVPVGSVVLTITKPDGSSTDSASIAVSANGIADFPSLPALPVGQSKLTASYQGSGKYANSGPSQAITVNVSAPAPVTAAVPVVAPKAPN